ncbi:MAG: hypothetical protein RJQ09_18515 [Cyclobacteriaceae bacterium]
MKYFKLILVIALLSCGDEASPEGPTNPSSCVDGTCHFQFFENSGFEYSDLFSGQIANIVGGDSIAFKFLYVHNEEPFIADDEISEEIIFLVPSTAASFDITTVDFEDYQVLYRQVCFCGKVSHETPSSGHITGKKLASGNWQIEADIRINYFAVFNDDTEIRHYFNEEFIPGNL